MKKKHYYSQYNLVLVGSLLLGLGLGCCQSSLIFLCAEVTAGVFLKLLRLLSLPLVFLAIGSTITSAGSFSTVLSLGKTILYYTLLTTIVSAFVGLGLFILIRPVMTIQSTILLADAANTSGYLETLSKTIPSNILEPFLENNVISATFLSALLSAAVLFLKQEEKTLIRDLFSSLFSLFLQLAKGILKLLPLATLSFSILFYKEASQSQDNLLIFSKYLLCIVGANLIQGLIVLPCLLKVHRLSAIKTAKAMSPALVTAFFSKSSASTLPLTMELAESKLGINSPLARFGFPLCSVINMNGCAAFILVTVLFISMSHGISFSIASMIGWALIATLAAVGNAGVPMGCYFLTSSLLTSMNVPLPLLGLILPFYTILDMIETSLNVWSDCCVINITNKLFKNEVIDTEL